MKKHLAGIAISVVIALFICILPLSCQNGVKAGEGRKKPEPARTPTPKPPVKEKPAKKARPEKWAVRIEKPGLPNFHRVTENLYRGAQPSTEGMRELAKMGIKTVVNLRLMHSDRDEIGSLPLQYVHIHAEAWDPDWDEIVRFLRVAVDERRRPVFVHCKHGADRTGLMCAAYRVAVCGWSKEEAIEEMTEGGFGFHAIWDDIVPYIRKMNVERLKRDAGITARARK